MARFAGTRPSVPRLRATSSDARLRVGRHDRADRATSCTICPESAPTKRDEQNSAAASLERAARFCVPVPPVVCTSAEIGQRIRALLPFAPRATFATQRVLQAQPPGRAMDPAVAAKGSIARDAQL